MNTTQQILNTAVVGCGAISDIYLENMIHHFDNLNVTACCANHLEHAKTKADAYGLKGCSYEEILKDPSIDMVVILTEPAQTGVKTTTMMRTPKTDDIQRPAVYVVMIIAAAGTAIGVSLYRKYRKKEEL